MNNETNAIEVFNNKEFGSVRTTMINGEPWFVAVDVCKALEIDATATRRLAEDEKNTLCLTQGTSTPVGSRLSRVHMNVPVRCTSAPRRSLQAMDRSF